MAGDDRPGGPDDDLVQAHRDALSTLVRHAARVIAVSIGVTLVGYGVAVWIWWKGWPLGAAGVATVVFVLFRLVRKHALQIAARRFARDPDLREAREILGDKIDRLGHDETLKDLSRLLSTTE
jgi:hypothetical protein